MTHDPPDASARLLDLYNTLRADVDVLAEGEALADGRVMYPRVRALPQHGRRGVVRAIFAFIEGVAFGLKQEGARALRDRRPLTAEEELIVREEIPDLDEKGRVSLRPANLRLKSQIRFAFQLYADADATGWELDVGGGGWQALQRAVGVRNRLMHPKSAAQLSVTDHELHDAMSAFIWCERELIRLLVSANTSLKNESALLKAQLEVAEARLAQTQAPGLLGHLTSADAAT